MPIDITKIKYWLELITEDGNKHQLNDMLINLVWEEHEEELAQRANITIRNILYKGKYLIDYAKLNCMVLIYADWGEGKKIVFNGIIWNWDYTSAIEKELTILAYDPLIRLQKSKDFKYFTSGMDTKTIVSEICSDWSIPLSYEWTSITHERKTFKAQTISEMIFTLLKEVKDKTGEKYVVLFQDDMLVIKNFGTNSDVYIFSSDKTISTKHQISMDNLVTIVKILGQEKTEGQAPVEAPVLGDTSFGILQEIIMRDSNKTLADATAEGQTLIKERGKPKEEIQVETLNIPPLRKGYKVKLAAGNLLDYFYVLGVSHNATENTMQLTLKRVAGDT